MMAIERVKRAEVTGLIATLSEQKPYSMVFMDPEGQIRMAGGALDVDETLRRLQQLANNNNLDPAWAMIDTEERKRRQVFAELEPSWISRGRFPRIWPHDKKFEQRVMVYPHEAQEYYSARLRNSLARLAKREVEVFRQAHAPGFNGDEELRRIFEEMERFVNKVQVVSGTQVNAGVKDYLKYVKLSTAEKIYRGELATEFPEQVRVSLALVILDQINQCFNKGLTEDLIFADLYLFTQLDKEAQKKKAGGDMGSFFRTMVTFFAESSIIDADEEAWETAMKFRARD